MSQNSLRFVLFVVGILLGILGAVMLIPAVVDLASSNTDWHVFAMSSGATTFVGCTLALSNRVRIERLDVRAGYLLTTVSWVLISAFAALPLTFSSLNISFTNALFETVSGLTTTGSTVLVGLDNMPPGILLWRSLIQWIGGVGIVVMAMVMLPALRIGGMQLFKTESSDISGKSMPRVYQLAGVTLMAYTGLTVLCTIFLVIAGMNLFDAVNHAMTALATGGYSTKDASVGFYNSLPIEIVLIVFMTAGALPLVFYARMITHGRQALTQEWQVRGFLGILVVAIGAVTVWRWATGNVDFDLALREAAFNVTSVLTDTGFATTDFSTWGSFSNGIFFLLFFVGGCAGSTAGAVKIFRWQVMLQGMMVQLRQMLSPNRVLVVQYAARPVEMEMLGAVRNFLFVYVLTFAALSLGIMATGLDFLSSTSAVAQAMANAGPGLGPIVGPGTNFSELPSASKWILMLGMLLGRLELSTIYVLLLPDFWRR